MREGTKNAEAMLERAISLDPGFSTPYAWLSYVRVQEHINEWRSETEEPLRQTCDLAKKSVALDEADPDAHNALACAYLWLGQHDKAIAEYERTIGLDPNNARAHVEIGWVLHYAGRSAEAIEPINCGMRLDPQYPDAYLHILAQDTARPGLGARDRIQQGTQGIPHSRHECGLAYPTRTASHDQEAREGHKGHQDHPSSDPGRAKDPRRSKLARPRATDAEGWGHFRKVSRDHR
jgi:tetratricopeptide (TPR) repeat protein